MRMVMTLGELYCGAGGLGYGAITSRSGKMLIRHGWGIDIDADSCRTYSNNVGENVICTDITSYNITKLPHVDIFAYGFPCNDFSVVGKRDGLLGKYGSLYQYGIKIIDRLNPLVFVAENVGGISSALNKIVPELQDAGMGYNVNTHLYKAEQYGVPQKRHRFFIIGVRCDINMFFIPPAPTHQAHVPSHQALANIDKKSYNNEMPRVTQRVRERLSYINPGKNVWVQNMPEQLQIQTKLKMSHIYRRLHPDKPSHTVTGSGGGGTNIYHYNELRPLTNRELARLQTFPDTYRFYGNRQSARKQIGMAVPPLLSRIIFSSILNQLHEARI